MQRPPEHNHSFPGRATVEMVGNRLVSGERSVSPTIGVVLMLAVTISIAVVIIPFVLSIAGDATDSAPQTDFSYSYSEGIANDITDDFAQEGGEAQGLVRIDVESGDSIPAEQVRVNTTVSGGTLADTDVFDEGDRIHPGDTITVWAARGDQIDIIWTAADGGESATLERFTVGGVDNLIPPGAPEPEEDCEYVEGEDNPNIQDTVVQCDLTQSDLDTITIGPDAAWIGTINASEEVTVLGEQYGDVIADDVNVTGQVYGDVSADQNLTMSGDDAEIDGAVSAGTDGVRLDPQAYVTLDIDSDGEVDLTNATVGGSVSAEGTVTLDDETTVQQQVTLEDSDAEIICDDSESTIDDQGCTEYKEAVYSVSIVDTNEPIEETDPFDADVEVENTGWEAGEQDVKLFVDEDEKDDEESVQLDWGEANILTLNWTADKNGTVAVNVTSEDDYETMELHVYDVGEAPATFEKSYVTLTDVHNDELRAVEFDWELDRVDEITLEVDEDSATQENDGGVAELDGYDLAFPVTVRTDITDSECFEMELDDTVEEGDEFDILESGWSC